MAYLTILGVLIIATVAGEFSLIPNHSEFETACVIGAKKSEGAMIAITLLPSETPSWANIKVRFSPVEALCRSPVSQI